MSAPAPAIRRSSELRQQEIVEAVLDLTVERGVEAVTTTLIAERLGLTQGAVFRHFPYKEAIWVAVLEWLKGNLMVIFERRPESSPLAEVERIFLGYMAFITANPAMPRLIFSDTFHHGYPALHNAVRELIASCETRVAAIIGEAGEVPPERVAPASKLLFTTIQGLAFQFAILGLVQDPRAEGPKLFALWRAALTCTEKNDHD